MAAPCQEISLEKLHLVSNITPECAKLELKNSKFNHRNEKEFFNTPELERGKN